MTDILPNVPRRELLFTDYRDQHAQDCDILLWEPTTWAGHFIAAGTDGPFCHATVVLRWRTNAHGVLMSVGFEEHRDAVADPLAGAVRRNPGKISVFRVNVPFGVEVVKESMIRGLEGKYAWGNIWLFGLKYLPGIRWFKQMPWVREKVKRAAQKSAGAICSQFVAMHFEDDVSFVQKYTAEITPNDLGQSAATGYLGTLV